MTRIIEKFLLVLPFCFSISASQSGWVWQNPRPTGNSLRAVTHTPNGNFVFVGEQGTILLTTDLGLNWRVQTYSGNSRSTLNAVAFTDDLHGRVAGDSGTILVTNDGAISWTRENSGTLESITGISMVDRSNIVAVGASGTVFKSTDSGEQWSQQAITPGHKLNAVAFTGHKFGLIMGDDGILLRTTDGGANWSSLSVSTFHLYAAEFLDSTTWVVVGGKIVHPYPPDWYGTILRTTDQGATWSVQESLSWRKLNCISSGSATDAMIGGDYTFLRTTDGGGSWFQQSFMPPEIPGSPSPVHGISLTDPLAGMCFRYNQIYATNDAGLSWYSRTSDSIRAQLAAVSLSSPLVGYAVGKMYAAATSNGGLTWVRKVCSSGELLRSVSAVNDKVAFAFGDFEWGGFKTTDGGTSWATMYTNIGSGSYWYGVSFFDEMNGTAVGAYGYIIYTANGGVTWNRRNSGTTDGLRGVSQVSPSVTWVVGDHGRFLRTTNYGITWSKQTLDSNRYFSKISTVGTTVAYILTDTLLLFRTSDGGSSWDRVRIPTVPYGYLYDIKAVDAVTLYGVGDLGTIIKTTDGGNTWDFLGSGTKDILWGVSFAGPAVGTVVGYFGSILHTTNSGLTWMDEKSNPNVPTHVILDQNYPNPFNPSTHFRFELPSAARVSLKIYDMLGKEIAKLVDEYRGQGVYVDSWNATGYSTGIYFYKLDLGSYSEVRKMLLMK